MPPPSFIEEGGINFSADSIGVGMTLSFVKDSTCTTTVLVGIFEPNLHDITVGHDEDFIRFW